jgi:hypothetical protein
VIGEVPTRRKHGRHSVVAVNMSTLTALHKQRHFSPCTSTGGKAIPLNSKQNERRSNFLRVIALERQLLICTE